MISLILLIVGIILAGFILWWLFLESEGVYLGRRTVIWLYDVYARRYDNIKEFNITYEHLFLAQPIMERIEPHQAPLVLDVATGTGRLPLALYHHARFEGHVIGVDLSLKMLHQAANKIQAEHCDDMIDLICTPAEKLPFADNSFDVVTCLEALEFMINREQVLIEMIRVLRPGGLLLLTNRINTRWMPGKLWSKDELANILTSQGMEWVEFELWQHDYQKVWSYKSSDSPWTGPRLLDELLYCPRDGHPLMIRQDDTWVCPSCHFTATVDNQGIIIIQQNTG